MTQEFLPSVILEGVANATINLPLPVNLPGTDIQSPHFLIADGRFPIKTYIMKPYLRANNLTVPQRVFNFRLSHALSV